MVEIDIHNDIANNDGGVFLSMSGGKNEVFSVDTVKNIFQKSPQETDFKFNIHCNGGSVYEGLAEYDIIRTSGKNIFMNIEGACHSMAVCLLLAAPKENRTANVNARALIHEVHSNPDGPMNASQLRTLASSIEQEQNTILDIYTQRTGTDRPLLEKLMKEERVCTAKELLQYGFISKINNYTTNLKTKTMSKDKKLDILNRVDKFLGGLKNLLGDELFNYDFKDKDGNVMFSTEKDDDSLAVGDAATPDGTFEIEDGSTVIIAGGLITEIQEAPAPKGLKSENVQLQNKVEMLTNSLTEAHALISDLKNKITSNYSVSPRNRVLEKTNSVKSVEDLKNEAREKRTKKQGGR